MVFAGCAEKKDKYTEEQHIIRITRRLNEKMPTFRDLKDEGYDSFAVYPLYDENDELTMFLVEIEPYGFMFISLRDEYYYILSCSKPKSSMYVISDDLYGFGNELWSPYVVNKDCFYGKDYLINGNTERIYHNKSPYRVAGFINERKYLIETEGAQYICAVKKDGEFLNLISLQTFTVEGVSKYNLYDTQASIYITFFPKYPRGDYDL